MLLDSCKKAKYCLSCNEECYFCKMKNKEYCSISFASGIKFKEYIDSLIATGDTCIFNPPTSQAIGPQYCGDLSKAEQLKGNYESQSYKCNISYRTY